MAVNILPAALSMSSLALYRGIYTEERFQQVYGAPQEPERGLAGMLKGKLAPGGCRCSKAAALHCLRGRLPIASWLPRYQPKKWLLGDVIAGLTVGIVHIPQGEFWGCGCRDLAELSGYPDSSWSKKSKFLSAQTFLG